MISVSIFLLYGSVSRCDAFHEVVDIIIITYITKLHQKTSITSYFSPTNFLSGLDAAKAPGDFRIILFGEAFVN